MSYEVDKGLIDRLATESNELIGKYQHIKDGEDLEESIVGKKGISVRDAISIEAHFGDFLDDRNPKAGFSEQPSLVNYQFSAAFIRTSIAQEAKDFETLFDSFMHKSIKDTGDASVKLKDDYIENLEDQVKHIAETHSAKINAFIASVNIVFPIGKQFINVLKTPFVDMFSSDKELYFKGDHVDFIEALFRLAEICHDEEIQRFILATDLHSNADMAAMNNKIECQDQFQNKINLQLILNSYISGTYLCVINRFEARIDAIVNYYHADEEIFARFKQSPSTYLEKTQEHSAELSQCFSLFQHLTCLNAAVETVLKTMPE